MTEIEKAWRAAWQSPDRRDITEWASDNIKFGPSSPFPGFFDVSNVPWTRRWYEAFQDSNVRRIVISGSPQMSGKTVFAQVCMAWQAVNDPAPMGFYADTGIKAGQFRETRWRPMQEICQQLKARIKKGGDTKAQTVFVDGSFLLLLGAESEANRQSHTMRVIFKDEAWEYDEGWALEIDNRKKAFERTGDWKIVELGTGGMAGCDFANNHASGTCEVYEVPCEHCGEYYHYKWRLSDGGIFRWEERTNEDGSMDYQHLRKSVHIECPSCKQPIFYDSGKQIASVRQGRWRVTNPDADGTCASFTLPCFVPGANWVEIAEKWVRLGKGRNVGHRTALKNFIMFDLAEFWEDRPITAKQDLPFGDYTRHDMIIGKWSREVVRLATIDYQHGMADDREHFFFIVRAYAANGDSRLVDCGRVDEATELDDRLIKASVQRVEPRMHEYSRIWLDCAFKQSVAFEFCKRFTWCGVRGEDRNGANKSGQFQHRVMVKKGQPPVIVWRNYSEVKWGEVGVGHTTKLSGYVPWRSINTQACEEMLYELRSGKALDWTVPKDIEDFCPEYADHINSHARINISKDRSKEVYRWKLMGDKRKNPDHLYDCEKYQVGAALVAELVMDSSESV